MIWTFQCDLNEAEAIKKGAKMKDAPEGERVPNFPRKISSEVVYILEDCEKR